MPISVLMAVYNGDNPLHLTRAITSITTEQTIKPDQVVLIVDGPIHKSLKQAVIKNNEVHPSLEVYWRPKNEGLATCLNYGLTFCRGNFIARMDADDISCPSRFEKQIEYLEENPEVGIVGGYIEEFGADITNRIIKYPLNDLKLKSKMIFRSPFAHPSIMIRKNVLIKYRYNESCIYSQDIELWFRMKKQGEVFSNIPEVLLKYRITKNFYKRRSLKKAFGEFKIYVKGIYQTEGLNWRLIIPVFRLLFRLFPSSVSRLIYTHRVFIIK